MGREQGDELCFLGFVLDYRRLRPRLYSARAVVVRSLIWLPRFYEGN